MKRYMILWALLLALSLNGCGQTAGQTDAGQDVNSVPTQGVLLLEPGTWPQNAYTEGLPIPPGRVDWAMVDTERGHCSVSLAGVDEAGYETYLDTLQQAGFSLVETQSEEIQGQDYVSIVNLLSDGDRWLSMSYVPDRITLYRSLAPQGKPRKQADRMAGGSVYCRLRLPRNLWGFGDAMQFAKVALRRPVGPSWRSLAHWASASLLPPLAALGFAPTEAFIGFGGAR